MIGDPNKPHEFACDCPGPGYCEFLKRQMTPRQQAICQRTVEGLTPEQCDFYRSRWLAIGRPELLSQPYNVPLKLDCPQRGPEIRREQCQSCGGNLGIKVHACELHGECTLASGVAFPGVQPCPRCPDLPARQAAAAAIATPAATPPELPFTGPVTRNLIYHLGPFSGNGTWQRNIAQLRRRIEIFNGRRIATILTDPKFDPPELVLRECGDLFDETIVLPNDSKLREVVSFLPLFERIASTDENTITFFAHAKGVSHPVNDGVTVHRWTQIQYETCLDYLPLVEERLRYFPIVGSFKKIGRHLGVPWHYSGTYYWLRNARVFASPNWRRIQPKWWGTESWPGLHFPVNEAGTLFFERESFDLYQFAFFQEVVEPAYTVWREQHAHLAR